MKRAILSTVILGVLAVLAYALLSSLGRFRLESSSPSGEVGVLGLRFQGSKPHALDGTLRLFVWDVGDASRVWKTKIQTKIEWGRDLDIEWIATAPSETFAIKREGRNLMEFRIADENVTCIAGMELIASDPYKEAEQESDQALPGTADVAFDWIIDGSEQKRIAGIEFFTSLYLADFPSGDTPAITELMNYRKDHALMLQVFPILIEELKTERKMKAYQLLIAWHDRCPLPDYEVYRKWWDSSLKAEFENKLKK